MHNKCHLNQSYDQAFTHTIYMHAQGKVAKYIYIGIVTAIYAVCLYMFGRNLTFETLWYDEAGQFFISKGLNHYSDPYSPEGSVMDVISQNANYNQDPGGFSIILHFWSVLSDNIVWLRLLPFIFFIGAIVFTCLAVAEITHRRLIAYTSGLLLFALWGGHIPYELRPYSMELCGMAYGLWMIFRLRQSKHITITSALAYSLVFAFFLSARYTIIMFGLVYALFALHAIWKNGHAFSVTRQLSTYIAFCLPLIAVVLYSYIFAMRIQNGHRQHWWYITYLQIHHWPFYLYLSGIIISAILLKWQDKSTRLLTYIFLSVTLLFILLGYFELLPWGFLGNKGAAFVWLWYVTLWCISASMVPKRFWDTQWSNYVYAFAAIILITLSNRQFLTLELWGKTQGSVNSMLKAIPADSIRPIIINAFASPSIRYAYEYASVPAESPSYPESFILLSGPDHTGTGVSYEEYERQESSIKHNAPTGTLYINVPPSLVNWRMLILIKNDNNEFEPLLIPNN